MKIRVVLLSFLLVLILPLQSMAATESVLASWNDGPAKAAIISFVTKVTQQGADFIPVEERIAVFDNDGTLWSEQPYYNQLFFVFDRIKAMAPQHPEWKTKQPFKAAMEGDVKTALSSGEKGIGELMIATHSGMTTEEFEKSVKDWMATAEHPKFKRHFNELTYQPMIELLDYLRANGFKTYIVSGGGVEFMRPWAEAAYGIPPEQVIGSSGEEKFEMKDGKAVITKLPKPDFIDDGSGKPVGIQKAIGRRPVMAFGNSDGDLQMLQWAAAGKRPNFEALVHHTDGDREYAYDRQSKIGTLDKALDEAKASGWTLIDMKNDWNDVFVKKEESNGNRKTEK